MAGPFCPDVPLRSYSLTPLISLLSTFDSLHFFQCNM